MKLKQESNYANLFNNNILYCNCPSRLRLCSRYEVVWGRVVTYRICYRQVLEFLCRPGDDSHKEERQEALLELLANEQELHIDADKILVMAEHANLYVYLLITSFISTVL